MAILSIEQVKLRWKDRASQSGTRWLDGVNAVTGDSPTVKAANSREKWVARMNEQAVQDRWENNLRRISLQGWKDLTTNKGSTRYTSGINASVEKYGTKMAPVLLHIKTGVDKVNAMPKVTREDSRARLVAFFDHMASYNAS